MANRRTTRFEGAGMWAVTALWAAVTLAISGMVVMLGRAAHANRQAIDQLRRDNKQLKDEFEALSEVEAVYRRAQHAKRRPPLKLLGLIPVLWLVRQLHSNYLRVAAATAAGASVMTLGVVTTGPEPGRHLPSAPAPPAGAEAPDETYPVRSSHSTRPPSTTSVPPTTSSTVPAAGLSESAAESTGPAPPTPTTTNPALVPDPSTTTTLPSLPQQCKNAVAALLHADVCIQD